MGIDYYLVDRANKTFYELGRGHWNNLQDHRHIISDPKRLEKILIREVFRSYYVDIDREFKERVRNRIVTDLVECFGGSSWADLQVINDCTDDLWIIRHKGYKCIGTLYEERGSPEHKKLLDGYLNEHFFQPLDPPKEPEKIYGWDKW